MTTDHLSQGAKLQLTHALKLGTPEAADELKRKYPDAFKVYEQQAKKPAK